MNAAPAKWPLPEIDGEPDDGYLAEAFSRAGLTGTAVAASTRKELDPTSGTQLVYFQATDGRRYVLKQLPTDPEPWWVEAVGSTAFEVDLWIGGVTRNLPPPLRVPTIDVARHPSRKELWILMRDVSDSILDQDTYDVERFSWIIEGLAQFHARYLTGQTLPSACSLERHARIFTEPVLLKLGVIEPSELSERLAETGPYADAVPLMEEIFAPSDLHLVADLGLNRDKWLSPLLSRPQTLLHGDLQWKHIAPEAPETVYLLDWNLPVAGPPTADLAWCWFLDHWCSLRDPLAAEGIRQHYLRSLQNAISGNTSREELEREWHLSWLRAFVQLSWCLVAPVGHSADPTSRDQAAFKCRRAARRARWVCDKFL